MILRERAEYRGAVDGVRFGQRGGGIEETRAATETPIETVWDMAATDEAAYVIGAEGSERPPRCLLAIGED